MRCNSLITLAWRMLGFQDIYEGVPLRGRRHVCTEAQKEQRFLNIKSLSHNIAVSAANFMSFSKGKKKRGVGCVCVCVFKLKLLTGKFLLLSLSSCHMLTNKLRLRWSSSRCTDTFLLLLASRRSHSSSTSLKQSMTITKDCTWFNRHIHGYT